MQRLVSIAASKVCDETPEMKFLDKFFDSMGINFAAMFWCLLDASSASSDGVVVQNACINILRLVPSSLSGPGNSKKDRDRAILFVSNALLKEQQQCASAADLLRSSKSHVKFTMAWLKEVSAAWFSEILAPVRLLADSLQCEWQVDSSRSTSPEAAQQSVECVKQVVSLIVSRLCGESNGPAMPSEVNRFLRMLSQTIRKIPRKNDQFVASSASQGLGDTSGESSELLAVGSVPATKDDAATPDITPESLLIQRILLPQLVSGVTTANSSGLDALDEIRATTTLRKMKSRTERAASTHSMIAAAPISANLRRAFLLCSKVLNNVASGSPFGAKDSFMQVFNDFVSEQSQRLLSKMFDQSAMASSADLEMLRFLELESSRASTSREEKEDTAKLHAYLVDCIHFFQGIFENNFVELQNSLVSASASWSVSDQQEIGWSFRRTYFSLMEFKFIDLIRSCDAMRQKIKVGNKFSVTQARTYKNVCAGSEAVGALTSVMQGNTNAALAIGLDFIRADLMQHIHHENVFIEGEEFCFKNANWLPFPYPEAIHSEWCWVRHPGTRHESPKWKHRFVVLEVVVDSAVFPPTIKHYINCYKDRKPTRRGNPMNCMELADCVARKCVWNLPLPPPSIEIQATASQANSHTWEVVCHGVPPLVLSSHSSSSMKFWIHIVNSAAVQASRIRNAQASERGVMQNQYVFYQKRSDARSFVSGESILVLDDGAEIQIGSKSIPYKSIFPPVSHPHSPEVSLWPAIFADSTSVGSQPPPKPEIISFASAFEKNRFLNRVVPHFRDVLYYENTRPLKLAVMTWNAGCTRPADNFPAIVSTGPDVDIWVLGMQECLYNPVPPSKTCEDDWLQLVREALSAVGDFILLTSVSLWQIRIAVFVRVAVAHSVADVSTTTVATGFAGIVKNKGASAVSMSINGAKCLFICSHLAARPERVQQRKSMTADILKGLKLVSPTGSDLFPEASFDHIFWFGDLNYRVDLPFDQCITNVEKTDPPLIAPLYETDQLRTARYTGDTLASFHEQPINFTPTYRLEPGTASYGNKRGQSPSWCDRVLVRSKPGHPITHLSYDSHVPTMLSDHRPVIAQLILPCNASSGSSGSLSCYEVVFQKLTMSLSSLPPTANGAPPGKPFIRIYLSCGSLPQHALADDAKFAEIQEGYDKVDLSNPDDQLFVIPNQAASHSSNVSELSPEQEIARGSGSSSVSPHLLAESGLMIAAPSLVTATLAKRAALMSQSLSGSVILAADIDSRRASVLPQALQDKVDSLRKGSGHVFVGQLSWKEECSIPVITSAEITAAQFANSCITITLHDALSSAEDPPVLAVVELPIVVARPGASAEGSSFRTVKAPVEMLSSHIGWCSATYACRPSEAARRMFISGLDPTLLQQLKMNPFF